jgi:hypothetical protein
MHFRLLGRYTCLHALLTAGETWFIFKPECRELRNDCSELRIRVIDESEELERAPSVCGVCLLRQPLATLEMG